MKHEVEQSLVNLELESDSRRGSASFRFDDGLSVFAGHFPNHALVPGIYLIEAARLLAENATRTSLRIEEIANARFTAEVRPSDTVEVSFALAHATAQAADTADRSKERWSCDAAFTSENAKAAQVRLILARENAGRE